MLARIFEIEQNKSNEQAEEITRDGWSQTPSIFFLVRIERMLRYQE